MYVDTELGLNTEPSIARAIQENTDTSFSSSSTRTVVYDMQTTPTTETTVSFAKKVSVQRHISISLGLSRLIPVWVGSLVVKELKRVVEASEITK